MVRESARNDGNISFLDVDASSMSQLVEMVESQIQQTLHLDMVPAVVCSMDCRPHFRSLIQDSLFCVPVLSHQEISMNHEVKVVGNIVLDEERQFNG
jgi:type III secretion protein V